MKLFIKWDTGNMEINCENFFPSTQNKLNVLLKTINLDWEHKEEILHQILTFLKGLEQKTEQRKQKIKKSFNIEYQKMCDLQHLIADCKRPNGLPVTKDELKQTKSDLKEQKKLVSELQQQFKRCSRIAQKAKVNQDIIIRKEGLADG